MSTLQSMLQARAVAAPAGRRAPAAAFGLAATRLGIISDRHALAAIGPAWNALFERAGGPQQVFQTHGFVTSWAEVFHSGADETASAGPAKNCRCDLAIVTIHRGERLVLAWPLVLQRKLGLKILSWLGEPVAQYADLLVDPAEDTVVLIEAALAHAVATNNPDIVRLRRVRADAALAPFLERIGSHPANPAEAPCVSLGQAPGTSFEDRQSGKAKKNRRRLLRRLEEEHGKVEFARLAGAAASTALIDAALASKRDWIARRGLLAPALADDRFGAFMHAAAGRHASATGCSVFAMSVAGKPLAIAIGFACQGRLMLHLITYERSAEKFGVGVLNLESIMRTAEADGLTAVDLLPPTADYKLQWADHTVVIGDHTIGLTAAGRAWAAVLDTLIKPAVKSTFDVLPLAMKQRIAVRQFRHLHA